MLSLTTMSPNAGQIDQEPRQFDTLDDLTAFLQNSFWELADHPQWMAAITGSEDGRVVGTAILGPKRECIIALANQEVIAFECPEEFMDHYLGRKKPTTEHARKEMVAGTPAKTAQPQARGGQPATGSRNQPAHEEPNGFSEEDEGVSNAPDVKGQGALPQKEQNPSGQQQLGQMASHMAKAGDPGHAAGKPAQPQGNRNQPTPPAPSRAAAATGGTRTVTSTPPQGNRNQPTSGQSPAKPVVPAPGTGAPVRGTTTQIAPQDSAESEKIGGRMATAQHDHTVGVDPNDLDLPGNQERLDDAEGEGEDGADRSNEAIAESERETAELTAEAGQTGNTRIGPNKGAVGTEGKTAAAQTVAATTQNPNLQREVSGRTAASASHTGQPKPNPTTQPGGGTKPTGTQGGGNKPNQPPKK